MLMNQENQGAFLTVCRVSALHTFLPSDIPYGNKITK